MDERFDSELGARLTVDDDGTVRGVFQSDRYWEPLASDARAAAIEYLGAVDVVFGIEPDQLATLNEPVSYYEPDQRGIEFRFAEDRQLPGSATVSFYQTALNVPVWESLLTVTMKQDPLRVVSAVNSSQRDVDASLPSPEAIEEFRTWFRTAAIERTDAEMGRVGKTSQNSRRIRRIVESNEMKGEAGLIAPAQEVRLIRGRFFVYRYDPSQRFLGGEGAPDDDRQPLDMEQYGDLQGEEIPTLPLPPVDERIRPGRDYVVAEITFHYPSPRFGDVNWLALVELETQSVLYLRALAANVDGRIFLADPITESGVTTNGPDQSNAVLDPFRDAVTLPNLSGPVGGVQSLTGSRVTLSDIELRTVAPPTRPAGSNFDYQTRTDDFAAVNAYYHTDRFFTLVADLGFPIATYFDATALPLPVDHRGWGTVANQGNVVNAHCVGNGIGGIGHCCYALAHAGDTANPIGIAADWRVVLHELAGHGILYEWLNRANFGFAHSAGDSFAAILSDPDSVAPDRFLTFPWVSIGRRHDRTPAAGWGWAGSIALNPFNSVLDRSGYNNEQILSTTMFRIYQSIGGDSSDVGRRRFAARMVARLMLGAVATLTSNPSTAEPFANALMAADQTDWPGAGLFGGAYGKVIRWAFERQGLYQASGTPTPANTPGVPPAVDVYIDDGRAGEYQYQPVHWNTTTIWNRHMADGMTGHQEPRLGLPNYVYVRVRNRGTQAANDVVVSGYHCKPSAGLLWPADFDPLTTASIPVGTIAGNNTEDRTVGPFTWTPIINAYGHDCLLMIATATNDASNVSNLGSGETIAEWRLVPNDNNIGQRNVFPTPGGGGLDGLMAGLHGISFWVGNPNPPGPATITLDPKLPQFLVDRGWTLSFRGVPEQGVQLAFGKQREVVLDLEPGETFDPGEVEESDDRDVVVTVRADGAVIGGMTYRLDPKIVRPLNRRPHERGRTACRDAAERLLDCLDISTGKVASVRVKNVIIDVQMRDER